MFGVVSWAMGADHTGPVTIEATGARELTTCMTFRSNARPQICLPKFVLLWDQPGGGELNIDFVGEQATLSFWEFKVSEGQADLSPMRDGGRCCRQRQPRGKLAGLDRLTLPSHNGRRDRAPPDHLPPREYRLPPWAVSSTGIRAEQFIGDDQANRLLRAYREP
jgi:hypothetical protein